ncbi:hypothetical protein [Thiolinea disciformis]|uniref:hypothetical protein n=1 Tax=Thiolinea disciformis TaxID=125614 RepID=UPI00036F75FB|nr:hypothetical protein [Thiolinea disciformis]
MRVVNRVSQSLLLVCLGAVLLSACEKKEAPPPAIEDKKQPTNSAAQTKEAAIAAMPGRTLHNTNCVSCHDAKIYTRPEHKMKDLMQLNAQVTRCNANLAQPLGEADLKQLSDYINQAYYQFAN